MGLRRSVAVKFNKENSSGGATSLKKNLSIKKSTRDSTQKNNDGVIYEKNASNMKVARFKKQGLGEPVTGTQLDIKRIEMRDDKIDVKPKFDGDDPND